MPGIKTSKCLLLFRGSNFVWRKFMKMLFKVSGLNRKLEQQCLKLIFHKKSKVFCKLNSKKFPP